ncbi:MAG: OstA-like protein [Ekhidna sp.]
MRKLLHFSFAFVLLFSSVTTHGQKKGERIKYKADELFEFRENGQKIRRLIGNVVFAQESSTMYCDSSLYYVKENVMEAYGNVKIVDDSVTITSRRLTYDGNDQSAKLRQNVVYTKGERKLTTDFLDYNMDTEVGSYFNKGTLRDSTNVLVSETGYFYGKENYALFWTNVVLTAPDYVLKTDTLRYITNTKIAYSTGKTVITTEEEKVLHANGGEFRTEIDQSDFIEGTIETPDYYMEADELYFDDLRKLYDAKGNVVLTAKNDDVIIYGDEGYSDDKNQISKVYGNAVMKRILEQDTLYMSADTLVSIESEYDSVKRILAYPNVKVWKTNLQGLADSAAYFLSDSLLYFYDDPIFWNKKNQISGDTVVAEITEKEMKNMSLLQNAFLIGQDTIGNFNQVKGRTMFAVFRESEIRYINVNGNGESIYYVLDEDDSLKTTTMGMNRLLCSDMTIRFVNEEVDNISFYVKPEAKFIPPHELTEDIQRLNGFVWREEERPTLEEVLRRNVSNPAPLKPSPALPPSQRLDVEGMKPPENKDSLKNLKNRG